MTEVPAIGEAPIGSMGGPSVAPFVIDMAEDQVFIGLKAFLETVTQTEVSQGQLNRVPEPLGMAGNFIIMTHARRVQLSTTLREKVEDEDATRVSRSTRIDMQIDVYGPLAANNAQVITTLFRDTFGCDFLSPYGLQPLYCDDGRQMPLVNGEFQYEQRWMILASLQANPGVSTPAQFADSVTATLVEVA